jgi:hypothetical protein
MAGWEIALRYVSPVFCGYEEKDKCTYDTVTIN